MARIKCNYCGKIVEGNDDPRILFMKHVFDEHCSHIPWNLMIEREACYEEIYYTIGRKGKPFEVISYD